MIRILLWLVIVGDCWLLLVILVGKLHCSCNFVFYCEFVVVGVWCGVPLRLVFVELEGVILVNHTTKIQTYKGV